MSLAFVHNRYTETPLRRLSPELLFGREPLLGMLGLSLVLLMVPTLVAMGLDTRTLEGVNVWLKPFKFELSLSIYVLTLAFFARFLDPRLQARRWYRIYVVAVALAVALEMAWLLTAAALGVMSHFNPTMIGQIVYGVMGVAAVVLTSITLVHGIAIWRNPATGLSPVLHRGIALGLVLTLPLTLLTAGTMSSLDGHHVGTGTGAAGLFLLGWSREVGDLRVSHFFATHAMHFVPAFALVSAWLLGPQRRVPLLVFAGLFVALVVFTFLQALDGRPFLPWLG